MKKYILRLCLLQILFLLPAVAGWLEAASQTFRVKVVRIADGDTFTGLNRDSLQLRFRIYGIDAPEKKQAFGTKSKEYLSHLIAGKQITVTIDSQDRYGRYVAKVYTPDKRDVSLLMLQAGLAWHYIDYDRSAEYAKAEAQARRKKNGLWRDPAPTAPWDFRKKK